MRYFLNEFSYIFMPYNLLDCIYQLLHPWTYACSSFTSLCFRSSFLMHKYKRCLFSWYLVDWEYAFKNKEFPSKQVIYEESSKVMMMGRSHLSYNLNCSSWRGDSKRTDWFKNQLGTQEVHASQLIITHREILNEDHSNEYTKSWQTFHQDTIFDY